MQDCIAIILAVHNGEKFIEQQIQSILKQTYENWRLIVRNEASIDKTEAIVKKYSENYSDRIIYFYDPQKSGACQNFGKGVELSDANYIMFADCDDFWLPEKIEKTFSAMKYMESNYGQNTPLLVFTDLTVVDRELQTICPSFWKYQNLNPSNGKRLSRLLSYNVITGCTVIINKPLKILAVPVPNEAIMHDNWFGLIASIFGKIEYIDDQTILYRQHGGNDSGAREYNSGYILRKLREYLIGNKSTYEKEKYLQAEALLRKYKPIMHEKAIDTVEDFLAIGESNYLKEKYLIIKNGFFKPGIARNIGLFFKNRTRLNPVQ
jgi:glycosyltransferase involved in cell wall biosynthesis